METSRRRIARAFGCAAAITCLASTHVRALTVIDHLHDFNGLTFGITLNGIGQTFTATDPYLVDASFALTSSPDSRVWWNDAHIQVFKGFPDSFGPGNNTAIFTSPRIDFATLPQIGTFGGVTPVYELRLSTHGLTDALSLTPGAVYSLTLSNFGTIGDAFYAANQPSYYAGGASINHQEEGNPAWRGPFTVEDLGFKLVMDLPEPSTSTVLLLTLITTTATRRRRS